jgi:hypothetical protein
MKTLLKRFLTNIHYLFLPVYIALIIATAQAQKEKADTKLLTTSIERPAVLKPLSGSWFFSKAFTYLTTPYNTPYLKK